MNQIFSFKRYFWLVKRQWFENAAIYKWGIVLIVSVTGFLFWLTSNWKTVDKYLEFNPDLINRDISHFYPRLGQEPTFLLIGIFLLCIFGGWFFESLSSKHKKMFYFSLPVSPLERVVVAFTCVIVLFPVLLLTVFTIFDCIFVQLFNHIHGTSVQILLKKGTLFNNVGIIGLSLSFLSLASIFTFGSLILGRKGPIVTIIFIIAISFAYFWLIKWLFVLGLYSRPNFVIGNGRDIFVYLIPVWWVLMYFVMKKKEA